jgi:hypothetical protein
MDDPRYAILKASENFTVDQRSRLISLWDLLDASMRFECPLLCQLQRDY